MRIVPPATDITDAQRVAGWAAEAFLEGRFELGGALGRLAVQAHRMGLAEPVRVPFMGATRDEQPRHASTPAFDAVARAETAIMGRPEDLERAEQAVTQIFGPPAQPQLQVPETRRCSAAVVRDTVPEECRVPAFWKDGPDGPQGWYHVNPAVDQDHEPVIVLN